MRHFVTTAACARPAMIAGGFIMASVKGRQVRWYDPLTGRQRTKTCSTPRDAQRFAARQAEEARLYSDGYIDADQLQQSRVRIEPIGQVLALFRADLDKRQITDTHRHHTFKLLERAIGEMGVQVVRDLTLQRLASFFQRLVHDGKSANTHNHFRRVLCDFCKWLVTYEYLPRNPIAAIHRLNESRDRRRVSRALSVTELDALVGPAGSHLVSAARRRALYLFRLRTGLRCLEASRVRWSDADLDARLLTLRAEITKNRKPDTLPLSDDVCEALVGLQREALRSGLRPHFSASIFGPMPDLKSWTKDLAAAGVEPMTDEGTADPKCLRKTASAFLLRAGVDPIDALLVMRHRPPAGMALTLGTYGDEKALLARKRKAVDRVSSWLASEREKAQAVTA